MGEELFQEFLEEEFPAVSKSLVDRLDTLYPDRCPEMTDPDRLVWLKAGQRSVVVFLRSRYDQQQDRGKD
jgi:hypothetical protein